MINFETDINDPLFNEPVAKIQEHLNKLGTQHFIDAANYVSANGSLEFAVVGSYKDRSRDAAVVMGSPFGNGIWPHMVARAEALAFQLAEEGVRDSQGNLLPVVMPAAPCMTSGYNNLHKRDYADIALGNFYPIARQHIDLMRTLGYHQIGGVVAYSYQAVLAEPFARLSKYDMDLKGNVVIAEPPHAAPRSVGSIGLSFAREGLGFAKQVEAEAIPVIDELFATKQAARHFNLGVIKNAKLYSAILRGMSRGRLRGELADLVEEGIDTTLLHATNSKITPRKAAIEAYEDATTRIWSDPWNTKRSGFLNRQEITGTNHAFGDRVGRFAVIAARSLL